MVAGPGAAGQAGTLRFDRVAGVVARGDRAVLIADRTVVRAVLPSGAVENLAGGPGAAPAARIVQAEGLALQSDELLIADSALDRVSRVPGAPAKPPPAEPTPAPSRYPLAPPPPPPPPVLQSVTRGSPAPRRAGPPIGTARCNGKLPGGFAAVGAFNGTIKVTVQGSGALQLELIRGRTRHSYKKTFSRSSQDVRIRVKQKDMWQTRITVAGRCRQGKLTIK